MACAARTLVNYGVNAWENWIVPTIFAMPERRRT